MRRALAFLFLQILAACGSHPSTAGPGPDPDQLEVELSYEILPSVSFSGDLKLDLYLPKEGPNPFPSVVYIHGGGWSDSDRTELQQYATRMASIGFVGAAIEHRLAPDHLFPAAVHDAKAAVRWLRANAHTYDLDPSRIGVAGVSSGGHIAAMVGTTDGVVELEGESNPGYSSAVQAVAAFSPSLDLVGLWLEGDWGMIQEIEQFLGFSYRDGPESWVKASPISYVGRSSAPFLLLHGSEDLDVPYAQSAMMRDALLEAGVHVELFTAEGADHQFFNRPLWQRPTLEVMKEFFVQMLK